MTVTTSPWSRSRAMALRGPTGNTELLLQLRLAGHQPVWQQLPGLDTRPQNVGNLDVDERGTIGIDGDALLPCQAPNQPSSDGPANTPHRGTE